MWCPCVLVCLQISPFYKYTSHTGSGPPCLLWYIPVLTSNIHNDHISKKGHILDVLGLGRKYEFWVVGRQFSPQNQIALQLSGHP